MTRPAGRPARVWQQVWQETPDLLVAVLPLALTVLLLISGFTPILRTLSDPNTTWTGFAYQALLNRLSAYALALQTPATPPATLGHLREQARSSLGNPAEYVDLGVVERIGGARLSRARELFDRAGGAASLEARQAGYALAIREAAALNEQAHERIHQVQAIHAQQLQRLRLVLLLAAALSGLLSTALIWRSLRLWRRERQMLDGQRELLSLASHELRRPLQSLLLATDLLRSAQTPEDRLRYLGVVESSAGLLASRANLEHLDLMYGRIQIDWRSVDLARLLLEFRGPRTEENAAPARDSTVTTVATAYRARCPRLARPSPTASSTGTSTGAL